MKASNVISYFFGTLLIIATSIFLVGSPWYLDTFYKTKLDIRDFKEKLSIYNELGWQTREIKKDFNKKTQNLNIFTFAITDCNHTTKVYKNDFNNSITIRKN